jgi:CheY-like chemotaxis protein
MRECSILLVEDDADDVFFVSEALRRSGVELPLDVARNGQEAIDFLVRTAAAEPKTLRPCLMLLDLNLPQKTGLEVLKWVRQESFWKTIIVVVLTSSTSEMDMHQAYLLGANSYLIKPSDATKLREVGQFIKQYWLSWNQNPPLIADGLNGPK